MSEGHDMSKPNEGYDATTVAVVLNGDFPSLLDDMAATVQLQRCKRSFTCAWCLSLYQSLRACSVVFSMRT